MAKMNLQHFLLKLVLIILATISAYTLIQSWRSQSQPRISCQVAFENLQEHNGYIQFNLLGQHPTEGYFDAELFLYYPEDQVPPDQMTLRRISKENYAPQILHGRLSPWSKGKALKPLPVSLPTSDVTHKSFPFDSPNFDFTIEFDPPIRPQVIRFRNHTNDFIPRCNTFTTSWDLLEVYM